VGRATNLEKESFVDDEKLIMRGKKLFERVDLLD
jgi:hypothetical protein